MTLNEELDFVRKYLVLEKMRMGERLQFSIEVDPDCLDEKIPSMILQPLVENAVKHGIAPKMDGGKVNINIQSSGDELYFEIADNGMGLAENADVHSGTGLSNTRLRLEKMYQSPLLYENNLPSGFIVRFNIPKSQK